METLIQKLNSKQKEAVCAPLKHLLILAGAGSGKTRVLVHRFAWLCAKEGASPHRILAVTFTNKAAGEMRERITSMLDVAARDLWVGTFHGIAHRLLRMHHQEAGLDQHFQVLDNDDQMRLIKRILKNLGLEDNKQFSPQAAQYFINRQKDHGIRAKHLAAKAGDFYHNTLAEVYRQYENLCASQQVMDFAELLLKSYELWQHNPGLREDYQRRFLHVLVDEFQDTNTIQYLWLKALIGKDNTLMVVGDDDQSIYSWRGAKIENIQRFPKDFHDVQVVHLEQNYRSTQTILNAANQVIKNNQGRFGKELWTEGAKGEPILVFSAFNELEEARFVVTKIQNFREQGIHFPDIAILYRANAQSRVIEEALLQASIPYRVYGGLRFFDRAEIKNALAYCRLVINHNDDSAFERVINFPVRGIGDKTVEMLRDYAKTHQVSLWQAMQQHIENNALSARAKNSLQQFALMIETLGVEIGGMTLREQIDHIIQRSGLMAFYQNEPDEKSQGRVENLEELVNAASEFREDTINAMSLADFLSYAVLESSEGKGSAPQESVQLMTLHAAKGLEFPVVFLVGFEDELFPARAANDDPSRLEEERRLCYVGMTRAKQHLLISHAEYRRLYGENKPHHPSRFLKEIPENCLEDVRMKSFVSFRMGSSGFASAPSYAHAPSNNKPAEKWRLGQEVTHEKFGRGVVVNIEGAGEDARLQIRFRDYGTKWLLAGYVN